MTLELKRYKDEFFNNSTEPYRIYGIVEITGKTKFGEGYFATTFVDTYYFFTSAFEYVKDADTGALYVENGKWVGGAD